VCRSSIVSAGTIVSSPRPPFVLPLVNDTVHVEGAVPEVVLMARLGPIFTETPRLVT